MARTKIGQVSILPCGQYDSTKKYERLSVVYNEGCSYIAIKENQGQSVINTEYWSKLTEKGDKGDTYEVTEEDLEVIANRITEDANSKFNTNVSEKTTEFNTNAETKTTEFNENVTTKTNTFNNNATDKTTEFNNNVSAKTTDFNNNAVEKTTAFDENAAAQTNTFNENAENKLAEFNANVDVQRIIKLEKKVDQAENILPTTTVSGENVYIDNAVNYSLMSLSGEGKCEQVTTTGKNLFDKVNAPVIHGYTSSTSGTIVEDSTVRLSYIQCKPSTTYTAQKISGYLFNLSYSDVEPAIGTSFSGRKSSSGTTLTITTSDNAEYLIIEYYKNDTDLQLILDSIQIEEGETATEYEPYTGGQASPNPDYPQEITTITEAEYKGLGKNYFNIGVKEDYFRTSTNGSMITNTSVSAIDFTIDNNKIIINSYDNAGYPWLSKWITLEKNTDYTVSFLTNVSSFKIFGTNSEEVGSIGELVYNTESTTKKYFNSGEYEYYFVSFYPYKADTYFENIQIEKGTESTPYEPYQESTLAIDLQGNELCKVGNIADKLLIDRKGNVAIEKNMGKVVFDGNTQGSLRTDIQNENTICFRTDANVENIKNNTPVLSDYFTCLNNTEDIAHIRYVGNVGYRFQIFIDKTIATTVDGVKAWLQEHNTEIYYPLATPQIIELGTIENPEIFKGINNIVVETNLGNMTIEVEYVEDIQARISKLEQAFVAQGGI